MSFRKRNIILVAISLIICVFFINYQTSYHTIFSNPYEPEVKKAQPEMLLNFQKLSVLRFLLQKSRANMTRLSDARDQTKILYDAYLINNSTPHKESSLAKEAYLKADRDYQAEKKKNEVLLKKIPQFQASILRAIKNNCNNSLNLKAFHPPISSLENELSVVELSTDLEIYLFTYPDGGSAVILANKVPLGSKSSYNTALTQSDFSTEALNWKMLDLKVEATSVNKRLLSFNHFNGFTYSYNSMMKGSKIKVDFGILKLISLWDGKIDWTISLTESIGVEKIKHILQKIRKRRVNQ
jgi:hypothetical protein